MPVSALVLTVDSQFDPEDSSLAHDLRIVLGPHIGRFVPAVTTTGCLREARDVAESLGCVPGVLDVQLVSYDDDSPPLAEDEAAASFGPAGNSHFGAGTPSGTNSLSGEMK
jgi:hypothetical protein